VTARGDATVAAKGFRAVVTLMEPWIANPVYRTEAAELIAPVPAP